MKKIYLALVYIISVFSIQPLYSQDTLKIDDYYIDFSVPELGAFTLLNIKPDNISMPGNTKEFAASLLNVVSAGSNISPGLAIDWAPIKTFCKTSNPAEYKKYYLLRNLQFTFGTITDSLGSKVGAGIKWTFLDRTDPLLDENYGRILLSLHQEAFEDIPERQNKFTAELRYFLDNIQKNRKLMINNDNSDLSRSHTILDIFDFNDTIITKKELMMHYAKATDSINSIIKKISNNSADSLSIQEKDELYHFCLQFKDLQSYLEQYNSDVTSDFNKVKKQWLNDHWNATVLTFGAGWVGNSSDSKWSTLKTQLFKTYLNGKFRVSKKSQAIGMISFGLPHNITITDSSYTSQIFFGGRFLVGNAINRFSIDLGYNLDIAKSSSYNAQTLITNIGLEFKLDEGIFLEIAGGLKGEPSNFIKNSNILALGSLKYALHPKTRFNLPE